MTTLADLRLAAQQRCDRVNATTITTAEWNGMVNKSAAALYRTLTSTFEDYNVTPFDFTIATGNTLALGAGSPVPNFDKLRKLSRQSPGSSTSYVPVLRADSLLEFDLLTAPVLSTFYGNVLVQYMLFGSTLEIRPFASAQASYRMYYVPAYQNLVQDQDTIDGQWLAQNGIDEFIVVDVARKACLKEESLDTASLLAQEAEGLRLTILKQLQPRDDNQPGRITDVKRARAGAFGPGGFGGLGGAPW